MWTSLTEVQAEAEMRPGFWGLVLDVSVTPAPGFPFGPSLFEARSKNRGGRPQARNADFETSVRYFLHGMSCVVGS